MKKYSVIIIGIIVLFGLEGCASNKPNFARLQPERGVSVEHPDKMEKDGGVMTIFTGVLPPRYLVEVEKGVRGVWPLEGVSLIDKKAPKISGFCYSVPKYAFDKNPWRIPSPMKCVIPLNEKEVLIKKEYAFALFNKDGGVWIASPIGYVPGYDATIIDDITRKDEDGNSYASYDWKKFENDADYAISIMKQIGKTLPVINDVWKNRISNFGIDKSQIADDVKEIAIVSGNPDWEKFRKDLLSQMGNSLTLPNGEIVVTYLSEEEMEELLRKNPNVTPLQKFAMRLHLPIATPDIMALGLASSAIDGGIATLLDDNWNVCVARGTCQRRDLSEQIALIYQLYQQEHLRNMEATTR